MPQNSVDKGKTIHVLVVDDLEINREILIEMLAAINGLVSFETDFAEDGFKAMEKVKSKSYDLIIMDICMPGKDGYQTCREIRAMPINQPIIIALTASTLDEDRTKGLAAGMNDYLLKPIDIEELETVIKRHLAK